MATASTSSSSPRSGAIAALTVLVALAAGAAFASLVPASAAGATHTVGIDWLPALGVRLAFRVDGLSLLFALLITGIGALVLLYTASYLRGDPRLGRVQLYLVLFMGAMLGLVLADDVITLFVFWELTTVLSFLLIGFDRSKPAARRAALQALYVTGAGGLALLAGLVLLGDVVGSYRITDIREAGDEIRAEPLYGPILALVLIGAFTKSAQFPFHFWLPGAMAAPTPISAYLHSATMVKAGVYLLARFQPALGSTDAWFTALTITGAVTAVWASLMALRQSDLKLMLAWTTVMGLGTLVMFLGAEASVAIAAAMTFLLVHALYKCALFLVIGAVDHGAGTRDIGQVGGLARAMPLTALTGSLAALSMAGFPPFLGFIGKELKYEGALAIAEEPLLIAGAAVAANAMMVSIAGVVGLRTFFGRAGPAAATAHEVSWQMWLGPALLAGLGIALGVLPDLLGGAIIQPAVSAILGRPESVELALWHGVNLPLMMSITTVVVGALLFWHHDRIRSVLDGIVARLPLSGERAYDGCLDGLRAIAGWQTAWLQHGALSGYVARIFLVFALAVGGTLLLDGGLAIPTPGPDLPLAAVASTVLTAAAVVMVVVTASRLLAICALGVAGAGISLIFLLYGAVDVALTQLLVETLFVVILAIVLARLPLLQKVEAARRRPGLHAVVAIACGITTTALLLAVTAQPVDRFITTFYEAESVTSAYGRNIVNVILVDFRALDTLGEIAVVAIAALAVIGLIRLKAPAAAPGERP